MYSDVLCIDYALRTNFTRTFRKILRFVKDSEAERYIRIFLHRWDVQNIMTISGEKTSMLPMRKSSIVWCPRGTG